MDSVFRALADPSRRTLLDALRRRDGQTLTELTEILPEMTRFGVSSHLGVLEEAHLITTVREGRRKLHHLNPVPIREIQTRWLSDFTAATSDSLLALRTHLEGTAMPVPAHVFTIFIDAPLEAVWNALVSRDVVQPWLYDTITTGGREPGDAYENRDAEGRLMIAGTTLESDAPHRLVQSFRFHWSEDVAAEEEGTFTWELATVNGQTKLVVTTTGGPETMRHAAEGTPWIYSQLKSQLEAPSA